MPITMPILEIRNAKISKTFLGIEDHGIFTAWLTLDYGGSGQGFGGWSLDGKPVVPGRGRGGSAFGCDFLLEVLRTLEVNEWEKLPGTYCRAEIADGLVTKIGHPLKDKWFDPKALADQHRTNTPA